MMQGGDSFRLIVRRGPQPNQIYELTKELITVGRDITNDIVVNDPEVSRHHMRLTRGAGGYTLEDLGSTNGTFVNGQRLTGARPLRNGELVGLGETVTLSYEAYGMGAGTMPAAATTGDQSYSPPPGVQPAISTPPPASPPLSPYAPPSASEIQPPSQQAQPGYVPFSQQGAPQGVQPPQSPPQSPPIRYTAPPSPQLTPSGQPIYPGASSVPQSQPQYPGSPGASGVPGFDTNYDPYAVRDEDTRNNTRLILLGCGGLTLFCCCASIIGAFAIDQLCLWDRLPIVYDLLRALGLVMSCAA